MAIDLLRDRTIMAMPESVAPTYTQYAAKSKAVAAYNAPSTVKTQEPDEVSFTESAKSVARATDLAMKADGIDYEKVAAIKHQLETGTFEFNDERTALKMLGADRELDFLLS